MTITLTYDDERFADYLDMQIRRPAEPDGRWAVFATDIRAWQSWHATESDAMRSIRNGRHARLVMEMEDLEREGVDEVGGPSVASSVRCAEFDEILRLVCSYLELPQSESGPADDIRLYDRALEAADIYSRQADADLAENRRLRFEAEADRERLLQAVAPLVAAAAKLADVRDVVEGSSLWLRKDAEFGAALAQTGTGVFRKLHEVAAGIASATKKGR